MASFHLIWTRFIVSGRGSAAPMHQGLVLFHDVVWDLLAVTIQNAKRWIYWPVINNSSNCPFKEPSDCKVRTTVPRSTRSVYQLHTFLWKSQHLTQTCVLIRWGGLTHTHTHGFWEREDLWHVIKVGCDALACWKRDRSRCGVESIWSLCVSVAVVQLARSLPLWQGPLLWSQRNA